MIVEQSLSTNKQMWPKFVCFWVPNDGELATCFLAIDPFASSSPLRFEVTYLRYECELDSRRSNDSRYMPFALTKVYSSLKTHLRFGGTC